MAANNLHFISSQPDSRVLSIAQLPQHSILIIVECISDGNRMEATGDVHARVFLDV